MYTVTRQRQWPDGDNLVEVSVGGIDYTNPDALAAKYAGEFEEFADPREAVETAIDIVRAWRKDSHLHITIGVGSTHGMTLPFSENTFAGARAWAKQLYARAAKCALCGEILPESKHQWRRVDDWSGERFCSERCVERAMEFDEQQMAYETEDTDGHTSDGC
jgi:hypothetical protein